MLRITRKRRSLGLILAAASLVATFGTSVASAACAGAAAGGDWASHGGDLAGTRSQAAEDILGVDNVLGLTSVWNFSVTVGGGDGDVSSVPIVANGCVYVWTTTGWLFGLNADDGSLVWKYQAAAGSDVTAPLVHNGVVYMLVPTAKSTSPTQKNMHVVALDAFDGSLIYDGESLVDEEGANSSTGASLAYFEGLLFVPVHSAELELDFTGGYALVNAADGSLNKRVYSTPQEDMDKGVGTCSIWSMPAIDAATKDLYVGTGQPAGWLGAESEMCNAIIKVDLDQQSPTFGEIVGSAKAVADDPPYFDVDFGSAATLLTGAEGRQIVAQLQKAGMVTAAYTRHMTHAWRTPVSPVGVALGNYTPQATDGTNLFTVGSYPGQMISLSGATGLPNWATPVLSPFATNTVAYANGVVYFANEVGTILALDSATGRPLFAHPIQLDNQGCTRNQGGGVAIARHRIYASCGGVVDVLGL